MFAGGVRRIQVEPFETMPLKGDTPTNNISLQEGCECSCLDRCVGTALLACN